nr:hypothetical protein [Rhodococcus qingshengii]
MLYLGTPTPKTLHCRTFPNSELQLVDFHGGVVGGIDKVTDVACEHRHGRTGHSSPSDKVENYIGRPETGMATYLRRNGRIEEHTAHMPTNRLP